VKIKGNGAAAGDRDPGQGVGDAEAAMAAITEHPMTNGPERVVTRIPPGRAPRGPAAPERPIPVAGRWAGVARSARTRILIAYIVLLAISAVASTFAIREILIVRLNDSVNDALEQEVLEFEDFIEDGRNPETGEAFTSVRQLLNVFLQRQVLSDDEAILAYADGSFLAQRIARFPLDRIPPRQDEAFEEFSSRTAEGGATEGTFETGLGTARYRARGVRIGETTGAMVVTILPVGELNEIGELQTWGVLATLAVLLVASVIAWLIAGRALAPVRVLTETAHSISQSDLTRRITVYGAGDAADMARSFNSMLDRLEATFRSQRAFIQDTSHELRDPLTICRGHLELLGDDPEEREKTVLLVLDELDRMARIVDDLQLLADVEQPDFLRPEWIDLGSFTQELLAKARALGKRDWQLDESGEGMFVADRHGLTEAVMNLAHNAVHHTEDGAAVAVGTTLDADEVRLWIRDTGRGVPLSDQVRIFDRFTRGRDADRRYRGGGLGLAIVKALAEAHSGRVELESRLGVGSTFTIVIPRYRGEGGADGQDTDR
jgi:two-component system, OmpR family, sensor kinase